MRKIAVVAVGFVVVLGCSSAANVAATPHEAVVTVRPMGPITGWGLAEQLLRTGPTFSTDGRLVAAGRATSRDLQMAVDTAEHLAVVAMVKTMGREELLISPRTEWRGVKRDGERFVVTVIVTADGGALK